MVFMSIASHALAAQLGQPHRREQRRRNAKNEDGPQRATYPGAQCPDKNACRNEPNGKL
jgi:hypothetical protein